MVHNWHEWKDAFVLFESKQYRVLRYGSGFPPMRLSSAYTTIAGISTVSTTVSSASVSASLTPTLSTASYI